MQSFYPLITFVWLFSLSILGLAIFIYFWRLSRGVGKGNLISVLNRLTSREEENRKDILELKKFLTKLEEQAKTYIQKPVLIKFNPFKDLGGENSFVISLLDKEGNGVLITSLHSRERTRIYAKRVVKGKPEVAVSEEERKALSTALKR